MSPRREDARQLLLVEDNPGDADLIMDLLAAPPATANQVIHAVTLAEALLRLRALDVQEVLLDLRLPDGAGVEGVAAIRAQAGDVPIVVLAGIDDEALRNVAEQHPDGIVIDVPVHDPQGFELLATLRDLDRSCLLIVLTNHANEEFRRRSLRSGVDHFLAKSTDFERVADLVRALQKTP